MCLSVDGFVSFGNLHFGVCLVLRMICLYLCIHKENKYGKIEEMHNG